MKLICPYLLIMFLFACSSSHEKKDNTEFIDSAARQDSIFLHLLSLSEQTIPEIKQQDSMAFLLLPVKASCPSCRNYTLKSIYKYRDSIAKNHFIIISDNEGRKSVNGYFKENKIQLPTIKNILFIDSLDQGSRHNLFDEQPTIYYTFGKKALKKIVSTPSTVKKDMQAFFTGK